MAKGTRGRRRISSRQYRSSPYPLSSSSFDQDALPKKCSRLMEKKDWEDATCSVCMECPHNAVLLLCSSHDKGCRPYMCGTSFRYSNCLDQYKKAYTKVTSSSPLILQSDVHTVTPTDPRSSNETEAVVVDKCELGDLACPLCRGQVKGWTIVEPAREFLNEKKRSCMQDNCSFVGKYKELRKHMKGEHPSARPREVDPGLEQKWRRLEREREREDVMSTIRSTMPGAMVFGDYVIEGGRFGMEGGGGDDDGGRDGDDVVARNEGLNNNNSDSNLFNVFLLLHAFGPGGMQNRLARRHEQQHQQLRVQAGFGPSDEVIDSDEDDDDGEVEDDEDRGGGMSLVNRLRRQGRVLLGRSGRRRRRREAGER